ncbi:MAG: hypothetical protein E7240_05360 [Lachnospiraceae bacterium]|nr:hypothetical protein [Lachnospiraceae bacterium]
MKQKKKFGCGTIVWIIIGLMIVSALFRAVSGRRDVQENASHAEAVEQEESSISVTPKQEITDAGAQDNSISQGSVPEESVESAESSESTEPEQAVESAGPTVAEEPAEPEQNSESEENAGIEGVTPEFKETMDSYEAFFDEYIAFMEVYSKTDDTSALMTEYLSYMTKYVDVMQKLDEINEEELSDADALYYAQVSLRISEKLMKVAQ